MLLSARSVALPSLVSRGVNVGKKSCTEDFLLAYIKVKSRASERGSLPFRRRSVIQLGRVSTV